MISELQARAAIIDRDARIRAARDEWKHRVKFEIQRAMQLEAERDQAIAERDRLAADLYKAMLALKECE